MRRVRGEWISPILLLISISFAGVSPALAQWLPDGAVVCDSSGSQSGATVIADGSGGSIIAWQDPRSDTLIDVFVQRLNNAGVPQWKAGGVSLHASVAGAYTFSSKSLISDGSNGFLIAWADNRDTTASVVHMERFTLNGQVDPSWPDGGVRLTAKGHGVGAPNLVTDGAGGAIAVWEDARDTTTGTAQDIYAQRVNGSGVVQWAADGVPMCKRYGLQFAPQAAADGAGGAWVTWDDDDGRRILVQHVNGAGVTQFDSTGIALCDSLTSYRYGTCIVPDGSGGAVVAWYDARTGSEDIYVRRINSAGVPQWTANGIDICNDPGMQHWPTICPGGASDYIVAWVDFRSANPGDIYAQKVTSSGTTSWAANGVREGRQAGDSPPRSASDGSGGAYLGWDDFGGGICFPNVAALAYAQHVVSSSAVATGWPANGRSMSTLSGPRYSPVVANDGTGSVVIVWHDGRSGVDCDIYAQRIGGGGEPVSVDGMGPGHGVSLDAPQPNPSRANTRFDFRLAQSGLVRLTVVSPTGRLVRDVAHEEMTAGPHSVAWDGLDSHGVRAAAGFYLVRLELGGEHVSRPLVFLR